MMTDEEILEVAEAILMRRAVLEREIAARKESARLRRNAKARQKRHAEKVQRYLDAHPEGTVVYPQYVRFADRDVITVTHDGHLQVEDFSSPAEPPRALTSHEWIYMHCREPSDG